MEPVLSVTGLDAHYGVVQALHGISLEVRAGQVVTLLGANGAGKSTTLRALSNMIPVTAGTVRFAGEDITGVPCHRLPFMGLVHVPEGRRIFGGMSIAENLALGGFTATREAERRRRMEHVYSLFPVLAERRHKDAGNLSGGEQQMLALGRALMAAPKLLLLDEPSMGLAPLMVKEIMRIVGVLNAEGVTILLVEQNSKAALKLAQYGYVLETGTVAFQGPAAALAGSDQVVRAYLGGTHPRPGG
ncbi:MAG: ABC transporter ATP-binding protein [Acetobacteraceae bacterium]|nr:ABC transporter ATP-binding protein [Acetobacteraceae bacterium]